MEIMHKRYFVLDTAGPSYPNIFRVQLFASIIDKIRERSVVQNGTTGALKDKKLPDNISIMLADDDNDDREFFEEIVTEIDSSIKVKVVESGEQLMKILTAKNASLPDMLFLDLNMPGKDGKQCLREIKSDPGLMHLPVIIYSTSALPGDIKDTHLNGANLYLRKPNTFNATLLLLQKVFLMDLENMLAHQDIKNFALLS